MVVRTLRVQSGSVLAPVMSFARARATSVGKTGFHRFVTDEAGIGKSVPRSYMRLVLRSYASKVK